MFVTTSQTICIKKRSGLSLIVYSEKQLTLVLIISTSLVRNYLLGYLLTELL